MWRAITLAVMVVWFSVGFYVCGNPESVDDAGRCIVLQHGRRHAVPCPAWHLMKVADAAFLILVVLTAVTSGIGKLIASDESFISKQLRITGRPPDGDAVPRSEH